MTKLEIIECSDALSSVEFFSFAYLGRSVIFLNDGDIEACFEFIPNLSTHAVSTSYLNLVLFVIFAFWGG
jgi:hypothetical protein